ncbi:tetratricopeptide repeat protein [Pseudomonas guariconensis]|uniref:SirB1 family protein n=1 Tax=Pseudomonas TaxID=286 RepID=UPI001CE4B5E9|nr:MULTISPECIES: tetratricopeptide repeat protein [Pseudomonas]MCO7635260.1 tetratricopeptide repeat protein [Pseudomonas sp. S 311-6]MCO7513681.1 tetratricopeptide repeat protein [Pseudomonas putida]MCO7563604.1 tetratricopeptide repeat protein [Pseudomonas mosselii]MCO7595449.1 tetratricopeptide repeat protein [Pseudomonas guariconensis]MCO7603918.1 tetratricopeptide repeat protein [Pseudomonas guariconensis]
MNPRQACLACLEREPVALLEATLWIAAEHDRTVEPAAGLAQLHELQRQVSANLPMLPLGELAQPLLRQLNALGFQQDEYHPLRPQAALMDKVLQRRRGQPLPLAILALELARRLSIPLEGVNFPGHFLLRVPGADHLLDPCGGRRLYPTDCRELLARQFGPHLPLSAEHLRTASPLQMLQRLSRNLRQLHTSNDNDLAALIDAERVMQLGPVTVNDYLARATLYQHLDCPQAERFDLEHALLLTDDPVQRLKLSERLAQLPSAKRSIH